MDIKQDKKFLVEKRENLKDIREIKIDETLPKEERIRQYIEQIGNPYCYKDGEMVVSIQYMETKMTLQEKLAIYAGKRKL